MALAEIRDIFPVETNRVFSVLTQYENYPQFVDGCKAVQVQKCHSGMVRVHYQVSVMAKEIHYILEHREYPEIGVMEWDLIESSFFKKNQGRWEVKSAGVGKSDVLYQLDIEFKIPVPGFIFKQLVKGSLPGMMRNFQRKACA
jgi:ribosome-associated toxin RatA of RatAB toxin-antitoxin module